MSSIGPLELIAILVVTLGVMVVMILPFWKIYQKAGFPPALALTQLVPPLGLVVLFYVAYAKWPALQQD